MPARGTAAQDESPGRQACQVGQQADQASAGQFRIDQRRTAKCEPGPTNSSADHLAEAGVANDPLLEIIGQTELGSPTSPVELGAVFIDLLKKAATVYFRGGERVKIGTGYRKDLLRSSTTSSGRNAVSRTCSNALTGEIGFAFLDNGVERRLGMER